MEVVCDVFIGIVQQYVGYVFVFVVWQLGGDEGVGGVDFVIYLQWVIVEEYCYYWNIGGFEVVDQLQVVVVVWVVQQVWQIVLEFGVGIFVEYYYGCVGFVCVLVVDGDFCMVIGGGDLVSDVGVD